VPGGAGLTGFAMATSGASFGAGPGSPRCGVARADLVTRRPGLAPCGAASLRFASVVALPAASVRLLFRDQKARQVLRHAGPRLSIELPRAVNGGWKSGHDGGVKSSH
jgi:hypothetical protein